MGQSMASFARAGPLYTQTGTSQGRILLDIGAGCGVSGLIAARYGVSRVIISDVNEDALLFAKANILRNGLSELVEVRCVDIRETLLEERFDLILASEILYLEELHRPILKFLAKHLFPGGKAVLCTDLARSKKRFFKLAARDFSIQEQKIGIRTTDDEGKEERRVYQLHFLGKTA